MEWICGINFGAKQKIVEEVGLTRKIVDRKKVKVIGVTERSNVKLLKL